MPSFVHLSETLRSLLRLRVHAISHLPGDGDDQAAEGAVGRREEDCRLQRQAEPDYDGVVAERHRGLGGARAVQCLFTFLKAVSSDTVNERIGLQAFAKCI